jgi:hypothetical protein
VAATLQGLTAACCAELADALAGNGSIQELVLAQNDLKLEGESIF